MPSESHVGPLTRVPLSVASPPNEYSVVPVPAFCADFMGQKTISSQYPKSFVSLTKVFDASKNPVERAIDLVESRGFIKNSFYKGLTAFELFFNNMASREGMIASNANTTETGYIQRRITKMVEDLKWSYSNCVVNSKNTILDFFYGYDNIDPGKMINIGGGKLSFIDIKHSVDQLNKNHEWSNYKNTLDISQKESNLLNEIMKHETPSIEHKKPSKVKQKLEEIKKSKGMVKQSAPSKLLKKPIEKIEEEEAEII
jgi:DNA-directed RNA polymerase III subunit RPC1